MPPYDADDDNGEPRPWILRSLAGAIEDADVVLFATPEYNHSIPGQLKNALDWLSRPLATQPAPQQAGRGGRRQHRAVRRGLGAGRAAQGARARSAPA